MPQLPTQAKNITYFVGPSQRERNNSLPFFHRHRLGWTAQPHLVSRKVILHERERELRPRVSLAQNFLLFLPIALVLFLLHLLLLLLYLHLFLDHFESFLGLKLMAIE